MKHFIFTILLVVGAGSVPFFNQITAREYITQSQLEQATVVDLPGRIGGDYFRERDPENMTANAISKVSDLLSNYTGITLGAVGGLATLGFLGVISAPVAMLGAALVGGLALVGANSDRGIPAGLSQPNYGHMGYGPSTVYGVQSNQTGIMGGVFGWSDTSRTSRYNVGSLGISSSLRAPVRVNMQSPHVLNTANRGFNFDNYDSGYQNMPVNPMTGQLGMALPMGTYSSGAPLAPSSQISGRAGSPASPSGYGYNPYGSGMISAWNYSGPISQFPQTHYDRRSGNTFNNFFTRTDNAGILSGDRGTRADRSGFRPPWSGPSQYSFNWQQTRNAPSTYLSQSWEYQQAGQWKSFSPQGRTFRGWYPQTGGASISTVQVSENSPNFVTQTGTSAIMPSNPMDFRFGQPTQQYEVGLNYNYPMGNAYSNPAVPNNYHQRFLNPSQSFNYGYQPNFQQVDATLQYGYGAQVSMQEMGQSAQSAESSLNLNSRDAQAASYGADIKIQNDPSIQKVNAEIKESSVNEPSGSIDLLKVTELEDQRQQVYQQLLDAVKVGNESMQKELFDMYQSLGVEISKIRNR